MYSEYKSSTIKVFQNLRTAYSQSRTSCQPKKKYFITCKVVVVAIEISELISIGAFHEEMQGLCQGEKTEENVFYPVTVV